MIREKIKMSRYKSLLKRVFVVGEIYKEYYTYNNNRKRVFPRIHSVRELPGKLEYVFTLLDGMDPKEIKKKEFVFKQVFGDNIELDGDLKKFVLTLYYNAMPRVLKYNLNVIQKHSKGLNLPIVAGVDVNGDYLIYDMDEDPHLLIAGETGSGKSTQVRSILTTLINTLPPEKLQLHLADLKRTEFHLFRNLAHVESVSTKVPELTRVLKKLKKEIEKRGDLLDQEGVTHINDLKEKIPYIILCIDEVAMLKKEVDIMEIVEEISALGRALGIFLILSMQRPDSKVLDGKLKVNLTVRMGFRSADKINSNIIGTPGSELIKKSQKGRMYMKHEELLQIQAPYLDVDDARELLDSYRVEKKSNDKDLIVDLEEQAEMIQLELMRHEKA